MSDVKGGNEMKDLLKQVEALEAKLHAVEIYLTPYGLGKGAEELVHHIMEGRRDFREGLNHLKRAKALMDQGHGGVRFELKLGGDDDGMDG